MFSVLVVLIIASCVLIIVSHGKDLEIGGAHENMLLVEW
jgi:hypothetical protein